MTHKIRIHLTIAFTSRIALLVLTAALVAAVAIEIGSETLTMTTTYPSPAGIYARLITTGGTIANPVNTILGRDAGIVLIGTTTVPSPVDGRSFALAVSTASNVMTGDVYLANPKYGNPRWASYVGGTVAYTTPGTYQWQVPPEVSTVTVTVWGAGGGGAAGYISVNYGGGGGGGGGYTTITMNMTPGTVYTVTVGAGGGGGNPGGSGPGAGGGGSGTNSSFGTLLTAYGGSWGSGWGGNGGTPGSFLGGNGVNGTAGGNGTSSGRGGTGGTAYFNPYSNANAYAGNAGFGGQGGNYISSGSAGNPGAVVIQW